MSTDMNELEELIGQDRLALDKRVIDLRRLMSEVLDRTDEVAQNDAQAKRWLAVARTHFQQGLMALHQSEYSNEKFTV